jgi:hypothetical protein
MKRKSFLVVILVMALVFGMVLVGCPQPTDETASTQYTVTFNANGGVVSPVSIKVDSGKTIAELPVPAKTTGDTVFYGWYTKNGSNNDWGVAFTVLTSITADITVFAKWSAGSDVEQNYVWLWNKHTIYTVVDGSVASVHYEMEPTWSYSDETHYEQEYTYTIPYNTVQTTDASTYTMLGTSNQTIHVTRNGQTAISESSYVFNYTTTLNFVSESITDTTTHTVTESETVSTTYLDLASGLISRQTTVGTSTTTQNAGEPAVTPTNTDTYYTVELLDEADGVKTFKHYDTSTGGTGTYTVYKIKDGITLEAKGYTAGDVLSYTMTFSFPDNAIIRAKLPAFTLYSHDHVSTPASNNYQTCELVSGSETELVLLVKTFNRNDVLTGQYQIWYEKIAL